jgi:hypothetical protein
MSPQPDTHEAPARARRLTLSDVVEQLLQRGGGEHSSVTLSRNAKGETQVEVVVRTGEGDSPHTVEEAEAIATAVYNRLLELYPFGAAPAGTNGGAELGGKP